VLRKVIAIGLSAAVQAAALGAPLVHAHLGGHESDHDDATSTVHAHLSAHAPSHYSSGSNLVDAAAERTVYLQMFVAVSASSFHVSPALVSSFELIVPAPAPPREALHVVYGHDPPITGSRSTRAPPATLS
jgi:hypothetical protein